MSLLRWLNPLRWIAEIVGVVRAVAFVIGVYRCGECFEGDDSESPLDGMCDRHRTRAEAMFGRERLEEKFAEFQNDEDE